MKSIKIDRTYQCINAAEFGFEIGSNILFVVEHNLCHGCGTCEAVCHSDAIKMEFEARRGIYLPNLIDTLCDDCGACVHSCPGFALDLANDWSDTLTSVPRLEDEYIGDFISILRAYSNDAKRRENAASGGVVSEIVSYLMDTDLVEGAILTRHQPSAPLNAESFIAYNAKEIEQSQKSKYCPSPLNTILKDLIRDPNKGTYVYVGLPGQVHGLRLLQRMYPHLVESIPYVISLFTAHVPSQLATDSILYSRDVKASSVRKIEYRGGGNPGRMRIVLDNEVEVLVPHLSRIYYGCNFAYYFYPVREWLYFDKMSRWADASCGDNWMGGLKEQNGASTVIARSGSMKDILETMIQQKRLSATPMSANDLIQDQDLTRKLNIGIRLKIWRALGGAIPIYNWQFRDRKDYLGTFLFAFRVKLCELGLPLKMIDLVMRVDYFCYILPRRIARKSWRYMKKAACVFIPYRNPYPVKQKKIKAVLIGGYGYKDIGDEAMPHGVRNTLRSQFGDEVEIVMLSHDPECTELFHGEISKRDIRGLGFRHDDSFLRKAFGLSTMLFLIAAAHLEKCGVRLNLWESAREALDEIISADFVFNVGGGNINSVISRELHKKCVTYIISDIFGVPVYLSGQTIGPFYSWFDKLLAKWGLNTVRTISFRDKNTSRERLKEIGVNKPEMYDAADDSIVLTGVPRKRAISLLMQDSGHDFDYLRSQCNLLVALNLKGSLSLFKGKGRSSDLQSETLTIARVADHLVDEYGCIVVFVATDFSEGVDDRPLHKEAYETMLHKDSAIVLTNEYSDDELIGLLDLFDLSIGGRYHYCVFSAIRHTPFLGVSSGVYQRTKLAGIANLCGLPQCYADVDLETTELDELIKIVDKFVHSRDEIASQLGGVVPNLRERSIRIVKDIANNMKSSVKNPT